MPRYRLATGVLILSSLLGAAAFLLLSRNLGGDSFRAQLPIAAVPATVIDQAMRGAPYLDCATPESCRVMTAGSTTGGSTISIAACSDAACVERVMTAVEFPNRGLPAYAFPVCDSPSSCSIAARVDAAADAPGEIHLIRCTDAACTQRDSHRVSDRAARRPVSLSCPTPDDCKIAYVAPSPESTNAVPREELRLIDCDDAACEQFTDTDISPPSVEAFPWASVSCPSEDDCKVLFAFTGNSVAEGGDFTIDEYLSFIDCGDASCTERVTTQLGYQVFRSSMPVFFGGSSTALHCASGSACAMAVADAEGTHFIRCTDAACTVRSTHLLGPAPDWTARGIGTGDGVTALSCPAEHDCKAIVALPASGASGRGQISFFDCNDAQCSCAVHTAVTSTAAIETPLGAQLSCPNGTSCRIVTRSARDGQAGILALLSCPDATCGTPQSTACGAPLPSAPSAALPAQEQPSLFARLWNGLFGASPSSFTAQVGGQPSCPGGFTFRRVANAANVPGVGDVSGDGKDDVVTASVSMTEVEAFLGPDLRRVVSRPQGIGLGTNMTLGDTTGDGKADTTFAISNGDGTFTTPPTGRGPLFNPWTNRIRLSDVTGDGRADAVGFIMRDGAPDTIEVAPAVGNGFGPVIVTELPEMGSLQYSASPYYYPVFGDFNGDEVLDVAFARNETSGSYGMSFTGIFTATGNGDGTFDVGGIRPSTPGVVLFLRHPVAGDVNGDGRDDIVSSNAGDVFGLLINNGDETFTASRIETGVWKSIVDLSLGDFNGDGRLDILGVLQDQNAAAAPQNPVILLGNGNGSFQTAVAVAGMPSQPYQTDDGYFAGDFNGDGRDDIAASNWGIYLNESCGAGGSSSAGVASSSAGAGTAPPGWTACTASTFTCPSGQFPGCPATTGAGTEQQPMQCRGNDYCVVSANANDTSHGFGVRQQCIGPSTPPPASLTWPLCNNGAAQCQDGSPPLCVRSWVANPSLSLYCAPGGYPFPVCVDAQGSATTQFVCNAPLSAAGGSSSSSGGGASSSVNGILVNSEGNPTCVDSDGGFVLATRGSISGQGSGQNFDKCPNDPVVASYGYPTDNLHIFENVCLPYDPGGQYPVAGATYYAACPQGTACQNGACVIGGGGSSSSSGGSGVSGLLAHWTFDDGTGRDVSGNNRNGTLQSGASVVSRCLNLDGIDDKMRVPNFDRQNFTFASWIYRDEPGQLTPIAISSEQDNGWNAGFAKVVNGQPAGQAVFTGPAVFGVGQVTGASPMPSPMPTEIESKTFHHYAATYDGSTAKVYVDGQLSWSAPYSATFNSNGGDYLLGWRQSIPAGVIPAALKGQMDDVRIYDHALTAAEISQLTQTKASCDTGLLAHYTGAANGTTLQDASGNGKNGTMYSGASITNGCMAFDGVDDRVDIPNFDRQVFTFAAWAKKEDGGSGSPALIASRTRGGWGAIYGGGHPTTGALYGTTGTVPFVLNLIGGPQASTNAGIPPGEWHHLVITYNGSETKLYVDGQLDATRAFSHQFQSNGDLYHLGFRDAFTGSPGNPADSRFKGQMDDVRIYDRVLTASQISQITQTRPSCDSSTSSRASAQSAASSLFQAAGSSSRASTVGQASSRTSAQSSAASPMGGCAASYPKCGADPGIVGYGSVDALSCPPGQEARNPSTDNVTGVPDQCQLQSGLPGGKCYRCVAAGSSSSAGTNQCRTLCGDRIVHTPEQCDDGNTNNTDACTNDCRETCQDDDDCESKKCVNKVCLNVCGNSVIDPGEDCDDGNTNNVDSCSNACMIICTTDVQCPSGDCNYGVCEPLCGDGKIDPPEACDDGNGRNGDGCSSLCKVEPPASSSRSSSRSSSSSRASTISSTSSLRPSASICGNGLRESGEECDDGDTVSGDGCSAACVIEKGWQCRLPGTTSSGRGAAGSSRDSSALSSGVQGSAASSASVTNAQAQCPADAFCNYCAPGQLCAVPSMVCQAGQYVASVGNCGPQGQGNCLGCVDDPSASSSAASVTNYQAQCPSGYFCDYHEPGTVWDEWDCFGPGKTIVTSGTCGPQGQADCRACVDSAESSASAASSPPACPGGASCLVMGGTRTDGSPCPSASLPVCGSGQQNIYTGVSCVQGGCSGACYLICYSE